MDYPFLLKRGFVIGEFENEDLSDAPLLFQKDIEKINTMARNALLNDHGNYLILARIAIRFHQSFSFYLDSFEIEKNYYLHLAERFASKSDNDEGKYLLAIAHRNEGDIDTALSIFEDIWKSNTLYAIDYGKTLIASGKWGRAIEIYNELLNKTPDDREIWLLLADALFAAEEYEDADKAYLKTLQIDRDNPEAWYKRGMCLKKMGKWGGALQSFQTAVRKKHGFKEAYNEILDVLIKREMYTRAYETLQKMKKEGMEVEEKLKEVEGLMKK